MSNKNKWSRNQIILLIGLIISILGVAINFYFSYQMSHQQIIVNTNLNELKAKYAEINTILANNISVTDYMTIEQGHKICYDANCSSWVCKNSTGTLIENNGRTGITCS